MVEPHAVHEDEVAVAGQPADDRCGTAPEGLLHVDAGQRGQQAGQIRRLSGPVFVRAECIGAVVCGK